jgi:hypothetical protein
MAYEESLRSITLNADSSLATATGVPGVNTTGAANAGNQYKLVKVTGAHQCGLVSGATDAVVGVLQNKPQGTGQAATVAIRGVSKVKAAVAIGAGVKVYAAADGRVNVTNTGTFVGTSLDAATAADQLIPVLLNI